MPAQHQLNPNAVPLLINNAALSRISSVSNPMSPCSCNSPNRFPSGPKQSLRNYMDPLGRSVGTFGAGQEDR